MSRSIKFPQSRCYQDTVKSLRAALLLPSSMEVKHSMGRQLRKRNSLAVLFVQFPTPPYHAIHECLTACPAVDCKIHTSSARCELLFSKCGGITNQTRLSKEILGTPILPIKPVKLLTRGGLLRNSIASQPRLSPYRYTIMPRQWLCRPNAAFMLLSTASLIR
jgi:hypothetical protein